MICNEGEILNFLDIAESATKADRAFLAMVRPPVERAIKRFCRCSLEQATYTQILPTAQRNVSRDVLRDWDVVGSRAVAIARTNQVSACVLAVPEIPLRSITTLYHDRGAYAGDQSGDFDSDTELTAGTDYYVDWDENTGSSTSICRSGHVVLIGSDWSYRRRTVKITYVAGWTHEELSTGVAADVKLAGLLAIQKVYSRRGKGQGQIQSERLDDRAVTYAATSAAALPTESKRLLAPFVRRGGYM